MAHVLKVKQGAVSPLVAHYERTPELERGYVRGNIDPERTALNYNLRPADVRQEVGLAIVQHEQTSGRGIRKDANVLCDWVVTLPQDCPRERSRDFFESVAQFMEGRYGKGNVLGCYVHMDETTPHAHIPILPMRDGKLVASKVVNRADLKSFHGDLGKAVDAALGFHVSIELDDGRHLEKALAKSTDGLEEFKKAKNAAVAEIDAASDEAERRLEGLRQREGEIAGEVERLREQVRQAELEPAAESVSESLRSLSEGRRSRSREEGLRSEVGELRSRVKAAEGEKAGLEREIRGIERGIERVRRAARAAAAHVRELVEGLATLIAAWERKGCPEVDTMPDAVVEFLERDMGCSVPVEVRSDANVIGRDEPER